MEIVITQAPSSLKTRVEYMIFVSCIIIPNTYVALYKHNQNSRTIPRSCAQYIVLVIPSPLTLFSYICCPTQKNTRETRWRY